MYLLSLLLLIGLAFGDVREIIEREIYQRYGDRVKVRDIKIISHPKVIDKIELDMEYGKARAIAYLYSGKEKHQAYVESFTASAKIPKGTFLRRSLMKELPAIRPGDIVEAIYRSGNKVVSRGKVEILQ